MWRRSTIDVHPNFSAAPHLGSSVPLPKTAFSKNKNASRPIFPWSESTFFFFSKSRLTFRPRLSEKNSGYVLPLSQNGSPPHKLFTTLFYRSVPSCSQYRCSRQTRKVDPAPILIQCAKPFIFCSLGQPLPSICKLLSLLCFGPAICCDHGAACQIAKRFQHADVRVKFETLHAAGSKVVPTLYTG